MKSLFSLLTFIIILTFTTVLSAQTIVPPGPVSGTWTEAGSPYLVQGEITIQTGTTLNIEAGVEVNFQGHYKFIINGYLEALGTEADSILFTAANPTTGWHSLRFINAQDSSHLSYCVIKYGKATGSGDDAVGGGIQCTNSNPVIMHSSIRLNYAQSYEGGISVLYSSNPTIAYCDISNNSAEVEGGIGCYNNCSPIIDNCTITNNVAVLAGGGIYIDGNSNPVITNCIIADNAAGSIHNGGGLMIYNNSSPIITNCEITGNSAAGNGGGIRISANSNPIITDCTISGNTAGTDGGGISCEDCPNPVITNCAIFGNSAGEYGGGIELYNNANIELSNCTITGNTANMFSGGIECLQSAPTITNCTITGNTATSGSGGGMSSYLASPSVKNTIFEGNVGDGIYFYSSPSASFTYCDFWNNEENNFTGDIPTGLGVITGVNANGDPCDDFMNIFEDPDFVYPSQSDYRLQWGSACIDAGDPASPPDPDGTVCEMGAFCYDQSMFQRILLTPFDIPIEIAASGGSFDYAIQVTNIATVSLNMDIWCDVTFPNGSIHGPVLGPFNDVSVGSEATISRERTQAVPAGAPPGIYTYNAYAVSESDTSFDSFTFVKLAADGSDWYSGWFNTGEDFGEFGGVALAANLPTEYALNSPYPNPFNPTTNISYQLPKDSNIKLAVYDVMGREVAMLVDEYKSAGTYNVNFDANNLVSGVYFVRLEAGDFWQVQKVVLMK
jgi:parallel beta-helix repeat protein